MADMLAKTMRMGDMKKTAMVRKGDGKKKPKPYEDPMDMTDREMKYPS